MTIKIEYGSSVGSLTYENDIEKMYRLHKINNANAVE